MTDFLNTSLSGLLSFQRALATTSNNIANVSTEGYSRQRVNLGALPPENIGPTFDILVHLGVYEDVKRWSDELQAAAPSAANLEIQNAPHRGTVE